MGTYISSGKIVVTAFAIAACAFFAIDSGALLAQTSAPQPAQPVVRAPSAPQVPFFKPKVPCKVLTVLGASTSEKDLITLFGAANVKHQDINTVESETSPGTVIFPNDPKYRASFVWKDSKKRDAPEMIRITDKNSSWQLDNGVSTGFTLLALEKLNGKPFKLSGFDWDYGGNVLSWNGGKLETAFKSKSGKVSAAIRLAPREGQNTPEALSGDRDLLSSTPALRKLNPVVDTISILAP